MNFADSCVSNLLYARSGERYGKQESRNGSKSFFAGFPGLPGFAGASRDAQFSIDVF